MAAYERLSAQDASFVLWERRETPMHVGAIGILDAAPLHTADGGIDADRIAKHVESRLHLLPRYRKRLAALPSGHPIWIDDAHFDLRRHLKRAALPRPGTETELKELCAQILEGRLDRDHPLWEMWIVEGLEGDRFALVSKVHHCMVDGVAGMNLLTLLMGLEPVEDSPPAEDWSPAPEPAWLDLLVGEADRSWRTGTALVRGAVDALLSPRATLERIGAAAGALTDAFAAGMRWTVETRINRPIGPHRRIEWLALDLADAKGIKNRLGGTLNDVVLSTLAGALHRYFAEHRDWHARFDYRIVVPVNLRPSGDTSAGGNQVSAHFLSLPVAEADPQRRHRAVCAATERMKQSHAAEGIELITRMTDRFAGLPLLRFGGEFIAWLRPYNLIVTNVPGPRVPLYVLGARLRSLYPVLPLFEAQGLGVAVLSYDGQLGMGLIGDRELTTDLATLREAVEQSFEELASVRARGAGAD
jgi:diacylglycerol O-acyltransferase / wax synthase